MKQHRSLKKHILQPERMPLPVDLEKGGFSFHRLLLEIGFGNGEFPVHLAKNNPEDMVVGIEVSLSCVLKAAARIEMNQLDNVLLVHGDARFLLREGFAGNSVDIVYMNFPCPWPKKRHIKRRVTNPSFIDTIASVLKVGGYFEVMTDEEWYAEEIAGSMSMHKSLDLLEMAVNPSRTVNTKYERKWLEMGKNIYMIRIGKCSDFSAARSLKEENSGMHVKEDSGKIVLADLKRLNGKTRGDEDHRWVFRDSYTDGDHTFLIEVITSDSGFEQKFYLRIINMPEGYIIKIDETSMPFRTRALKDSMQDLQSRLKRDDHDR